MVTIKTHIRTQTWTKCLPEEVMAIPDYDDIIYINCEDAGWRRLPVPLPQSLQILICNRNKLTSLPSLPSTLHTLHGNFNKLIECPFISHTRLESLQLSTNDILSMKQVDLPSTLREIDLSGNLIREFNISKWSDHLVELNLAYNKLVELDPCFDDLISTCKVTLDHNDFPCQKYNAYTVWLTHVNVETELCKIIRHAKWGIKIRVRSEDPELAAQLPSDVNRQPGQVPTFYDLEPAVHRNFEPLPVNYTQPRWDWALNPTLHSIYQNAQNIHASSIQKSTNTSLKWLIDSGSPNVFAKDLIKSGWEPKHWWLLLEWFDVWHANILLNIYCRDNTIHSVHGLSYTELLGHMWNVIENHKDRKEILRVLRSEILDSEHVCFTGRFTRTLNALSGFVEHIQIGINDKEQMQNRIVQALSTARETHGQDTENYVKQAKSAVRSILEEFNIPVDEQEVWLDAI